MAVSEKKYAEQQAEFGWCMRKTKDEGRRLLTSIGEKEHEFWHTLHDQLSSMPGDWETLNRVSMVEFGMSKARELLTWAKQA